MAGPGIRPLEDQGTPGVIAVQLDSSPGGGVRHGRGPSQEAGIVLQISAPGVASRGRTPRRLATPGRSAAGYGTFQRWFVPPLQV